MRTITPRVRVIAVVFIGLLAVGAVAVALGAKTSSTLSLWLAAALVTAVIGVVIRPRSLQRAMGQLRPGRPPVKVNVVPRRYSVQRLGANWALPEPLADSELAALNESISVLDDDARTRLAAVGTWVYRMKGAEVGTTSLRLVFQGMDLPVAVVNIRAHVNARWPVFDGTSIIVGVGGGGEAISVYLDLDRPDALTDYFRDHAITIAPDETVVADVYASCRHSAVEWDLLIDFVRSGQTQTLVLNSADHQLRTTGEPAVLDAASARGDYLSPFEAYRAVVYFERDHLERAAASDYW